MVDMSQITDDVKPETVSPLDLFRVLAIVMIEDVQFVPAPGLFTIIAHDDDVFEGVTSPVMVESKYVDPPLLYIYCWNLSLILIMYNLFIHIWI